MTSDASKDPKMNSTSARPEKTSQTIFCAFCGGAVEKEKVVQDMFCSERCWQHWFTENSGTGKNYTDEVSKNYSLIREALAQLIHHLDKINITLDRLEHTMRTKG